MREDHEEPVFELQKWFDGGDIFYRPEDKLRLQFAVDAIVDDKTGLAVIGDNEAVLAHYCKMLLARLRELEGFEIEVFLPMNTVSLLKRFNELLATMSVDEARRPPGADKPVTLLVVNDANEIQEDQWSLLTRLLSDFPGVNVRLVLFVDKNAWPEYEAPLDQLGRRLYRWALQTATLSEAIELMRAGRQYGFERQTEMLLMESGLGAAVEGSYADPDLDQGADTKLADESANPFPDRGLDFMDGGIDDYADPLDRDAPVEENPKKRTCISMALVFGLALAVAWAILSRVSPEPEGGYTAKITETINEIKSRPDKGLAKLPGTADAKSTSEATPKAGAKLKANQTSQAQAVVKQLQQDREQKPKTPSTSGLKTLEPRLIPTVKPKPSAAPQKASIPTPKVALKAAPKAASKVAVVQKPRPPEAATTPAKTNGANFSKAIARVKSARASDVFVQHIVLSTDVQAREYIGRYSSLRKAMVLPMKSGSTTVYAIISGPFPSKPKAQAFADGAAMPADYWVRGAAQLRETL